MAYVSRDNVSKGKFDEMEAESKLFNEKNDCSVKAVAVVCGVTYAQARFALHQAGRRPGYGALTHEIHNAVKSLGKVAKRDNSFISVCLDHLRNTKNYVVKNVTTRQLTMFPELAVGGNWLVYTNGHVIAVKDGKVHCWGATRALRIKSVYEVS